MAPPPPAPRWPTRLCLRLQAIAGDVTDIGNGAAHCGAGRARTDIGAADRNSALGYGGIGAADRRATDCLSADCGIDAGGGALSRPPTGAPTLLAALVPTPPVARTGVDGGPADDRAEHVDGLFMMLPLNAPF